MSFTDDQDGGRRSRGVPTDDGERRKSAPDPRLSRLEKQAADAEQRADQERQARQRSDQERLAAQKQALEAYEASIKAQEQQALAAMRAAREAGDDETDALDKLTDAKAAKAVALSRKHALEEEERQQTQAQQTRARQQEQQPNQPKYTKRTQRWIDEHRSLIEDPDMATVVSDTCERVSSAGFALDSEAYWSEVENRVYRHYPQYRPEHWQDPMDLYAEEPTGQQRVATAQGRSRSGEAGEVRQGNRGNVTLTDVDKKFCRDNGIDQAAFQSAIKEHGRISPKLAMQLNIRTDPRN